MNRFTRIAEGGCFLVTIIGGTTSLIILIIIVGLFKSCFGEKIDPMDDTYMKEREMYDRHAQTQFPENGQMRFALVLIFEKRKKSS